MARDDPQMKLRLPADVKEKLEELAQARGRSMNSEILAAIEHWLRWNRVGDSAPKEAKILDQIIALLGGYR